MRATALSPDGKTIPEQLKGLELHNVLAATTGANFSKLDLGHAFRTASAYARGVPARKAIAGEQYTTLEDLHDAKQVVVQVMPLRGFPETGEGSLPYAIKEVIHCWTMYAGHGTPAPAVAKVAKEGRAYILAILKHFGAERKTFVASRNPKAPLYEKRVPAAAKAAWDQHNAKLSAALRIYGYAGYMEDLSSSPPARQQQLSAKLTDSAGEVKVLYSKGSDSVHLRRSGCANVTYAASEIFKRASARKCAALKQCCPHYGQSGHEGPDSSKHSWKHGQAKLRECRQDYAGHTRDPNVASEKRVYLDKRKRARSASNATVADHALEEGVEGADDGSESGGTELEADANDTGAAASGTLKLAFKQSGRGRGGKAKGGNRSRGRGLGRGGKARFGRQQARQPARVSPSKTTTHAGPRVSTAQSPCSRKCRPAMCTRRRGWGASRLVMQRHLVRRRHRMNQSSFPTRRRPRRRVRRRARVRRFCVYPNQCRRKRQGAAKGAFVSQTKRK